MWERIGMSSCRQQGEVKARKHLLDDPRFVMEVLSRTTEQYDRNDQTCLLTEFSLLISIHNSPEISGSSRRYFSASAGPQELEPTPAIL